MIINNALINNCLLLRLQSFSHCYMLRLQSDIHLLSIKLEMEYSANDFHYSHVRFTSLINQ